MSLTGEGSPFNGQVLDRAFSEAQAVVVLITGDDLARLDSRFLTGNDPGYERELTPQARPNVLFEAGMAFGRRPDKTILVRLGHSRVFSDIAGRNEIRISNRAEDRQALVARLRTAGCDVSTEHQIDWFMAGDFDAAVQKPDQASAERETSTERGAATAERVPNLTEGQKALLHQIVGVYVAGCHSSFMFCEATPALPACCTAAPSPTLKSMPMRPTSSDLQRNNSWM